MAKKEKLHLGDLAGNPSNPRYMREYNAKQLKSSIEKLGDLSCIVFNERTGMLVGGHQRKNVITKLIGEDPEVVITHEYKEPNEVRTTKEGYVEIRSERYKVRFVDFDEHDEALAILIANDKRNQGEYDMALLPTVVDLADSSLLAPDFVMLDFVEQFDFLNNQPEVKEKVEFEAGSGGDNKRLTFELTQSDFVRATARLDQIMDEMQFDDREEALIYILFS